jgi:DNA-binding transcriptional MerR regulator
MSESLSSSSDRADDGPLDHKSIGEVLTLLQDDFPDISISKIRFLETRGLVEPHRTPSGYRKFAIADVDRLRWILSMQRDHFLPLRVIKERLDQGLDLDMTTVGDAGKKAAAAAVPRSTPSRFRDLGPSADDLDPIGLARHAGLSAQQLDQLIKFGLLDPYDDGQGSRFTSDELKVAKAAASFLQHGIEPRHLKAWRVAAEREADMLEQIVVPTTRKGSPESAARAREVADDLVNMGNVIRETIIVKVLRERLGYGSD